MSQASGRSAAKVAHRLLLGMESIVAVLGLVGVVVVIGLQVWTRYVLRDPIPWTEELARFCLIWVVYVSSARIMAKNEHLAVDILDHLRSRRLRGLVRTISNFIVALTCIAMTYSSVVYLNASYGLRAPASQMPMSWVYISAPIGFTLMALHAALHVFRPSDSSKSPTDVDKL